MENAEQAVVGDLERATCAMKENRWADAIVDLRIEHGRMPANIDIAGKLGFVLSRDEKYDEAIRTFEEVCKMQPREAKWPYMVGYQYYKSKGLAASRRMVFKGRRAAAWIRKGPL